MRKGKEIKPKPISSNNNIINNNLKTYGKFNENGKRLRENNNFESELEDNSDKGNNINRCNQRGKRIKTCKDDKNLNNINSDKNIIDRNNLLVDIIECSICLERVKNTATISECKHEFCKSCLEEWVKKASICPLCRISFKEYSYFKRSKMKKVQVSEKEFSDYYDDTEEEWYDNSSDVCMICNNSNNTHLLLICDGCNYNVCHTYCTNLDKIPDGDWHCKDCLVERLAELKKIGKNSERLKKILFEDSDLEEEKLEEVKSHGYDSDSSYSV